MKFFLNLVFIFLSFTPVFSAELPNKTSLNIEVDKDISLAIDVYMPSSSARTKALIIVSPGSYGTGGDEYLWNEISLKKNILDADRKGGLVKLFNDADYAVAFFWQRGLLRGSECIKGDSYDDRVKALVTSCYLPSIRKHQDLYTTTSDTEKVYKFLGAHKLTSDLPVIALGLSEGSYHISKLIELKKIHPLGIVYIGGMFDSMSSTIERQGRREYFFKILDFAFNQIPKEQITTREITEVKATDLPDEFKSLSFNAGVPGYPLRELNITMGGVVMNRADLPKQKQLFEKRNNDANAGIYEGSKVDALGIYIFNFYIPNYSSSLWNIQANQSNKRIIDQLSTYDKKVRFLYGSFDYKIKIPSPDACDRQRVKCKIEIIDGVGHGLEDKPHQIAEKSLVAILRAVNDVAKQD